MEAWQWVTLAGISNQGDAAVEMGVMSRKNHVFTPMLAEAVGCMGSPGHRAVPRRHIGGDPVGRRPRVTSVDLKDDTEVEAMPEDERTSGQSFSPWYALLVIPFLALLWPGLYAREHPELWGVPFFYWYQFLWVILGAVLTETVYAATRRRSAK